jgi:hypothetical protein
MRRALRLHRPNRDAVRFHNGPQGQPVPCFDEHCTSPHLAVEDTHFDAG